MLDCGVNLVNAEAADGGSPLLGFLVRTGTKLYVPTIGNVFTDRSLTPTTPAEATDPVGTILEYRRSAPAFIAPASDAIRGVLDDTDDLYSITFDGVNDEYDHDMGSVPAELEMHAILRCAANDSARGFYRCTTDTQNCHYSFGNQVIYDNFGATVRQSYARGADDLSINHVSGRSVTAAGAWKAYHNGATRSTQSVTTGLDQVIKMGPCQFGTVTGNLFQGAFYGLAYGPVLSTEDRAKLVAFLKSLAGIS